VARPALRSRGFVRLILGDRLIAWAMEKKGGLFVGGCAMAACPAVGFCMLAVVLGFSLVWASLGGIAQGSLKTCKNHYRRNPDTKTRV
jgi:predicted phage tail protein